MSRQGRILPVLALLLLLLLFTVAPAFAYWPDWLEHLFRLLIGRMPTPTPTPTPAPTLTPLPVYLIRTPEEGLELLEELPKGKGVRVVFHEGDINRYLAHYAGKSSELRSAWIDFEGGEVFIHISVDSNWLRRNGWRMFSPGEEIEIEAKVRLLAIGCKPFIRMLDFQVNGRSVSWGGMIEQTANAYLQREWRRVLFCVRGIQVTDESLVITGYKMR